MPLDGTTKYENLSKRFHLKSFDYQKQFSHLYAHRLAEMTALLKPLAEKRWGAKGYPIKKLCDLREEQSETCIIIGTIYKHQQNKPSILREISEENQLAPQPARKHYADPEDKLILEDELQRVRLQGNVDIRILATGVVCAAVGIIEEDGRFIVDDLLFWESGPQRPLSNCGKDSANYIVLLSGLDVMNSELNCVEALNMFQFWLGGSIFSTTKKEKPNFVRLIVAGDSVRSSKNSDAEMSPTEIATAMCKLDKWFVSWASCVSIDVMPGGRDPANFMLPQQPFHRCMLPNAAKNSNFQSVSNPYECSVDDVSIIGCSGQNVEDLLRTTMFEKPLDALRSTLKWGHLAPTAPDTLACYPYIESDPLIMHECPHIYFAGNCKEFATELYTSADGKRTRLICVPTFSITKSVAIVDLNTLDCRQICFSVENE